MKKACNITLDSETVKDTKKLLKSRPGTFSGLINGLLYDWNNKQKKGVKK